MPESSTLSIDFSHRLSPAPAWAPPPPAAWTLPALAGYLTELSEGRAAACLTLAFGIVLDAQRRREPVAWLTPTDSSFFPPDVADGGIDLGALVVVRLPAVHHLPRAAELLARSGAFGLLVLDLGLHADIPIPMQMRLVGLAHKHATAILCLTRKGREMPSLGSLVSLRCEALRRPAGEIGEGGGDVMIECMVQALKDKRRGPRWAYTEMCRGPDGLR